jgi:hypothetical protein
LNILKAAGCICNPRSIRVEPAVFLRVPPLPPLEVVPVAAEKVDLPDFQIAGELVVSEY